MSQKGIGGSRQSLLIAVGGGAAGVLHDLDLGPGWENLIIDTDSRTEKRYPKIRSVIIGEKLVNCEGSGGNMNLARACFKLDMENLAPLILGRPLVMILCSTEGATGIAGAVEISSLLIKVGMPAFSFLLHDDSKEKGGIDPLHVASMLLDGPLRPGCILMKGSANGSTLQDPYGLSSTIPFFLSDVMGDPGYVIPSISWALLRDDGGPFEIGPIEIDIEDPRMDFKPPAVLTLLVPEEWTTEMVRSTLYSIVGKVDGVHLGLSAMNGIESIKGAYIAKASHKVPSPEGPPPDAEMLKDLVGGPMDIDISPARNIQ